ncbi:MAG: hypothetical protein ACTHPO_03830 [Alphaproteobacteria bacterium]
MNSMKKLFNWVADGLNGLFPEEWHLSKEEQRHLMVKGYKVRTYERPVVPSPFYTAGVTITYQEIKTHDDRHLTGKEAEKVRAILQDLNDQSNQNSNQHHKPE